MEKGLHNSHPMEQLETLISQIRRDPEAHRDHFLRKWEEFCAAFAVLRLTPQLYKLDTMALLNFVAQVCIYSLM